jgi:tripartite-type tricarboxylate transporter receptor subunit TctC
MEVMQMKRLIIVGLSFVFIWIFGSPCLSEIYPSKPIKLVIPWGPGGSTDIIGRKLGSIAEKILGQPIIVENYAGGSGTVGLAKVATSEPDGYTLVLAPGSAIQRSPYLIQVTYDPMKDFVFVCKLLDYDNGVLTLTDKPYKTFKELVAYAKTNPGKVIYATPGAMEGGHVAMYIVAKQEGIDWKMVPYKSGSDAMVAVLGGHADFYSGGSVGVNLEHVRAGTARLIAVLSETRWKAYPDVPTLFELGYNHINRLGMGIIAPAGLPENIRQKLEDTFLEASKNPEFLELAEKFALNINRLKGSEYMRTEKEGYREWKEILDNAGMLKK